jgi:putative RNA 2'-phosphotransferase
MKNISKFLSLLLRHQPEKLQLDMDSEGWVLIHQLLDKLNDSGNTLSREELQEIVDTNDKKRFVISKDSLKIRASQGHTIDIDLKLKSQDPPHFLYHGTSEDSVKSILKEGLKPQSRNHVHLSSDIETATKVGMRKGKVKILKILAKKMNFDGYKFYISENGVWLADFVPSKYIELN